MFKERKIDAIVEINGIKRQVSGVVGLVNGLDRMIKICVSDEGVVVIPSLEKDDDEGYELAFFALIEKYRCIEEM